MTGLGVDATPAMPVRVALLPIVVYSAGDHEYLREGLGSMLAARLGQDPGLRVVRVQEPGAATLDAEAAREAARATGAEFVLYGSFTRFGEGASLDLQCERVGDEDPRRREFFVQSGTLPEIIPKLDPLAKKVARYVSGTAELGADGPEASPSEPGPGEPGPAAAPAEVEALRQRLEALEAAVFGAAGAPESASEAEPSEEAAVPGAPEAPPSASPPPAP